MPHSAEIHSVILNLNKNYAQNVGSDFSQIVNKQLEIKENTLVALYTGNLVRKPIVLEEDTTVTLDFNAIFPSVAQLSQTNILPVSPTENTVSFTMPRGEYSKLTFCRLMCNRANRALASLGGATNIAPVTGTDMTLAVEYQLHYSINDGQFFLGLRRLIPEVINNVSFYNLDDGLTTSQGITRIRTNNVTRINATTAEPNFNRYTLGNQPIMPQCFKTLSQRDDPNVTSVDIGATFATIQCKPPAAGNDSHKFFYGLSNTYFQSQWASVSPVPTIKNVDTTTGTQCPLSIVGALFEYETEASAATQVTCNVSIVLNSLVSNSTPNTLTMEDKTERDAFNLAAMLCCQSIDLADYEIDPSMKNSFGWVVYAERLATFNSLTTDVIEDNLTYYVQFVANSPYEQGSNTIIWDSKEHGYQFSAELVESGYLFQQLASPDPDNLNQRLTGGLCPQFFFKNCDQTNVVLTNPTINSPVVNTAANTFLYQQGIRQYSYNVKSSGNTNVSNMRNILGVAPNGQETTVVTDSSPSENTLFSPNFYPELPDLAGITQLGSDGIRYNVEVNLPVRAFNTTESSTNDLGQVRNILHNSNPVVEDVTNLSAGLVNKNLEPHDIKYLSLNNDQPIKLNELKVNIRRAKTNELAPEIEDASIELLFKKDN